MGDTFEATVIGAGPGGLSTVAALLDSGIKSILWVDRDFKGGRLNTMYREISSNTKTGLYLDAIHTSHTCNQIIESTPEPNAVTRLKEVDRDETCELGKAGDVLMMLIDGILNRGGVENCIGEVEGAELEEDEQWTITLKSGRKASAPQLHLSTGSYPRKLNLHTQHPQIKVLDLDQVMILSSLPSLMPSDEKSVVGIIGNSHSGILAAMNLYTIATSNHGEKRDLKVISFQRREILFAEYREDGIVWDNSGLKGRTAEWAKEHLLQGNSKDGERESEDGIVKQIRFDQSPQSEKEIYANYLPRLTHLIYAVGYDKSPLPTITLNHNSNSNVNVIPDEELEFDMHSSGFHYMGKRVKGLYGTGIAFPEETEDPDGHVEAAVGWGKFMKFAERIKGEWGKVV